MTSLAIKVVVSIVLFLLGGGTGWYFTSNAKEVEISQLRQSKAEAEAKTAKEELADFVATAKRISDAASEYGAGVDNLNKTVAVLRKDRKNEKPLPIDCVPDDGRVRNMQTTIDAINKTFIGQ